MSYKEPVISVLMPVFNGELYVAKAIDSVLGQTFNAFEFIIVDDGSEDNTTEIISSYTDVRIKIINQKHHGIAYSLNNGLGHCKCEYIARMDADDLCHPKRLEKQIKYLSENENIGAVSCKVAYDSFDELPSGYMEYVRWTNQLIDVKDILINRFVESPIAHPSIFFRRSLIEEFGNYTSDNVPEDYELWLRWMHANVKIAKIDEELLIWNDRKSRLSRIDSQYSKEAFYKLKAIYFARWYQLNGNQKPIYIWGKGNVMRRRLKFFENEGIEIAGYIDIVDKSDNNFIYYLDTEQYAHGIVLGFVSDKRGKSEISKFLVQNSFKEGSDFFHVV